MAQLPHPRGRSPEIFEEIGGSVRHLAHSAHLRTVRGRVEQCTRRLHQTCAYPWSTFPENLVELRPLLPGVTPGLFVFQGKIEQGSCCNLGGKIGDVLPPNFEGLYLRSTMRESNAVFGAEVGNMSPTTPQDAGPLRRLSIFEGFLPCSPSPPGPWRGILTLFRGAVPGPTCVHISLCPCSPAPFPRVSTP